MPRREHYLLGDTVPVRVSFNANGHRYRAEVPDEATGRLRKDISYLGRVFGSGEVEAITEVEFQRRCEDMLGTSRFEPDPET